MKFYMVSEPGTGTVIGCELTKAKAIKVARINGGEGVYVERLTLACDPREAIRRLLGGDGGYAGEQTTVYIQGPYTRKPKP